MARRHYPPCRPRRQVARGRIAAVAADQIADEAVEHLRALIRFDTCNPPGNERPAAEYVAEVGRRAGLEAHLLDSEPGHGNAVLRLRGGGGARPILLLGHLDTVPCEPERWTHSPWAADVADGC